MTLTLSLLTLIGAMAVGAMSPGPAFLFVVQSAVAGSRRDGLAAALGMGAGAVVFALLVMAGLQALLREVTGLFLFLKTAGALYLLYLAIGLWRGAERAIAPSTATLPPTRSPRRTFLRALLTQLSNPKTLVVYGGVFAALLPPNLPRAAILWLPMIVFVVETSWYAIVAVALSSSAPRQVYLRGKPWLDRIAASVMGLLGVRLLLMPVSPR